MSRRRDFRGHKEAHIRGIGTSLSPDTRPVVVAPHRGLRAARHRREQPSSEPTPRCKGLTATFGAADETIETAPSDDAALGGAGGGGGAFSAQAGGGPKNCGGGFALSNRSTLTALSEERGGLGVHVGEGVGVNVECVVARRPRR